MARCHANGTKSLQLTQNFKNTIMPRWSLDGQRLAFSDVPPESYPKEIYVLDLHSQLRQSAVISPLACLSLAGCIESWR